MNKLLDPITSAGGRESYACVQTISIARTALARQPSLWQRTATFDGQASTFFFFLFLYLFVFSCGSQASLKERHLLANKLSKLPKLAGTCPSFESAATTHFPSPSIAAAKSSRQGLLPRTSTHLFRFGFECPFAKSTARASVTSAAPPPPPTGCI